MRFALKHTPISLPLMRAEAWTSRRARNRTQRRYVRLRVAMVLREPTMSPMTTLFASVTLRSDPIIRMLGSRIDGGRRDRQRGIACATAIQFDGRDVGESFHKR